MTRVAVVGNAGGGKSTLCRELSAARRLPYYPVDQIQWRPGWRPVADADFVEAHASLLSQDRWLIDGFGPWLELEKRFDLADTIILIDLPLFRHYWWATKRQVTSFFVGRADGPEGCPMWQVTFRLYRMIWSIHRHLRPKLLAALNERRESRRILHIKSVRELAEFRARFC